MSTIRKSIIFLMLFLLLPFSVKADNSLVIRFEPGTEEYTLGSMVGCNVYKWQYAQIWGDATHLNIEVYDSDGKLIAQGLNGQVTANEKFPLKFVLNTTDTNYWLDLRITGMADGVDLQQKIVDSIGNLDNDINNKLSDVISKLGTLSSLLDGVNSKLSNIYNSLTDPTPLNNSMQHLESSIDNLNKAPLVGVGSTKDVISSTDITDGELPKMIVTFAPGITYNAFDLSHWQKEITIIRRLLVAILYISLFLYFVQYIQPRFKV